MLVICTETYRQRVEGKTPPDEGRGVFWEGGIIYNYLYNEKGNKRFIPVLLPGATEEDIPQPLRGDTRYQPKTFDLNDAGYLALYRELTGQRAVTKPIKGAIAPLPSNALPALNIFRPDVPSPSPDYLRTFVCRVGYLAGETRPSYWWKRPQLVDADQKFRLIKSIEEARAKIREHGGMVRAIPSVKELSG